MLCKGFILRKEQLHKQKVTEIQQQFALPVPYVWLYDVYSVMTHQSRK